MKKSLKYYLLCSFIVNSFLLHIAAAADQHPNTDKKQTIKAIYIPLADHYAGIVAYEKYRDRMKLADYQIERMKSWPLLRAYFMSGEVDMAYIACPQAMDMFREKPNFRWVSLMQRDGNALAINELLNAQVNLAEKRKNRKPDAKVAQAFARMKDKFGSPTECGVPHMQSTHTVVLYKYLKDHGMTLGLGKGRNKDVIAVGIPPPKSPAFIKKKESRGKPASFEQSLPWADVVETHNFGHVAWYSKDVLPWPDGHVECIAIATDICIKNKRQALQEVIYYIHKAGLDIEAARIADQNNDKHDSPEMIAIAEMVRKHIPEHDPESIFHSLRLDLNVINYKNLNLDKPGLKQIMDLAVEGGILKKPIDIHKFADNSFATEITYLAQSDVLGVAEEITQTTKAKLDEYILMLKEFAANPALIKAVEQQNSKDISLDQIKAIDREWIEGKRESFALSLQNNSTGQLLRKKVLSNPELFTEMLLCDEQGAVISEYPITSDYWQGDENKFTACYNDRDGKPFIGPLEFDQSSLSYSVQISVPVKNEITTIGVLVTGIRNLK